MKRLVELARHQPPAFTVSGIVSRINPSFVTASGLSKFVTIGDAVSVEGAAGSVLAEVAAIDADSINITPLRSNSKITLGAAVHTLFGPLRLQPHESWSGRAINSLGEPVDGLGPIRLGGKPVSLHNKPPPAMARARLGQFIPTGIKAIDLFTPICSGQRIGVFAGSGVGKSTLLAMLSRVKAFDRIVIALVGERGREVRDFLDDALAENRSRVIAVVATSDESAMMRRLAPDAAMTIAEYFRDAGENVLLIIDSITRLAHAIRELALAIQEPPVARGYPPSVFGAFPQLLERAGPGENGTGSITAFVSVLVDGDDHNEPIADAVRGILDGHIVLDRAIAAQGRFPALDPLRSLSRLAPKLRDAKQAQFASQIIDMIARFEDTRDLRTMGGYQKGHDPALDRAIELVPRLYDALKQQLDTPSVDDVYAFLFQSLKVGTR
ncbi:MAG: FliI/YscN family ATPase [Hyphomicrobium sp.]